MQICFKSPKYAKICNIISSLIRHPGSDSWRSEVSDHQLGKQKRCILHKFRSLLINYYANTHVCTFTLRSPLNVHMYKMRNAKYNAEALTRNLSFVNRNRIELKPKRNLIPNPQHVSKIPILRPQQQDDFSIEKRMMSGGRGE
jgi:hypothetical protein